MTDSSRARPGIAAYMGVVALSATTMLWLFWHHPIKTLVATFAVLTTLAIAARWAGSLEPEMTMEPGANEPSR